MCSPLERSSTRSLSSPKSVVRSHSAPSERYVWPCSLERLERALDGAGLALVQRALGEPAVEVDAEARRASPGCGSTISSTPAPRQLVGVARRPRPAISRRQLGHVVALVAVLRHAPRRARGPGSTRRSCATWRAGVVDVVLALDRRGRWNSSMPRQRVAVGGVAAAGRRQRPGRVGARRTRPGPARRGSARAARRSASPAAARRSSARAYQASARNRLRKPGPGDLDALEPRRPAAPAAPRRAARRSRAAARRAPAPAASPRWSSSRRSRRFFGRSSVGARAGARLAVAQLGGGGLDGGAELLERSRHRVSDGRARRPGSCGRGRAARAAPPARAGAAASSARARAASSQRSSSVPYGPPTRSRRRGPPAGARSSNAANASESQLAAAGVEQHDVGAARGSGARAPRPRAPRSSSTPRLAAQQLLVVLDVVGERRAQPPDGEHDVPHVRRY